MPRHALDDPIVDSDTFAPFARAPLPPNLFFLFTRCGGHVGWCEGWNAARAGRDGAWGFQNRAVFEFVDAVLEVPATCWAKYGSSSK